MGDVKSLHETAGSSSAAVLMYRLVKSMADKSERVRRTVRVVWGRLESRDRFSAAAVPCEQTRTQ